MKSIDLSLTGCNPLNPFGNIKRYENKLIQQFIPVIPKGEDRGSLKERTFVLDMLYDIKKEKEYLKRVFILVSYKVILVGGALASAVYLDNYFYTS